MKILSRLSPVLAILICLFLVSCSPGQEDVQKALLQITLPDLDGNTTSVSEYKGRVIMLNFWATWCPPCQDEVPDFVELYERFGEQGLTIIGISMDQDPPDAVKEFVRENEMKFLILYAGDQAEDIVEQVGGIRGIPTTFLLDRDGNLVVKMTGVAEKADWENAIQDLL